MRRCERHIRGWRDPQAGRAAMDITRWLGALGLQEYEHAFRESDVDTAVLPELTSNDLIALGVTRSGTAASCSPLSPLCDPPLSRRLMLARRHSRARPRPSLVQNAGRSLSCSAIWSARHHCRRGSIRRICARSSLLLGADRQYDFGLPAECVENHYSSARSARRSTASKRWRISPSAASASWVSGLRRLAGLPGSPAAHPGNHIRGPAVRASRGERLSTWAARRGGDGP